MLTEVNSLRKLYRQFNRVEDLGFVDPSPAVLARNQLLSCMGIFGALGIFFLSELNNYLGQRIFEVFALKNVTHNQVLSEESLSISGY